MVHVTRRRALQGAVGLLAGLAGCNDGNDGNDGSPTPTERRRGLANVETDPDQFALRASLDGPLAWFEHVRGGRGDNSGGDDDEPTARETTIDPSRGRQRGLIANRETAATLSFAAVDGAADARTFVEETDFERESIFLDQRSVPQCYRLELCYVTWNDRDVETRYGRFLRDHDVVCETDADDALATFVRIPDALDPERVTGSGSGVRSGACFPPPGERGDGMEASGSGRGASSGGDEQ